MERQLSWLSNTRNGACWLTVSVISLRFHLDDPRALSYFKEPPRTGT